MAAHRAQAGAVAADIAAQQGEIGELLDVLRAVAVLGDAHAEDEDGPLGLGVGGGRLLDVGARQAGDRFDIRPLAWRRGRR